MQRGLIMFLGLVMFHGVVMFLGLVTCRGLDIFLPAIQTSEQEDEREGETIRGERDSFRDN